MAEQWYIFTFGCGQKHANRYVKIYGTYFSSRMKMHEMFGDKWAFQYTEDEWQLWEEERPSYFPVETLLLTAYADKY